MQFIKSLPISQHLDDISQQLQSHGSLVLTAEPGAGKSTAVPLFLMQQAWLQGKKIIMLEPRRVAAKAIAHFLARQLGESVGQRVGYRVKNDNRVSANTQLEIVTEGILTRQIQQQPELDGVALVIFDEFHERSVQADLGLMLVKEIRAALREDLHCLVMSATIDSDSVSQYLEGAPVKHVEGRTFPVDIRYLSPGRKRLAEVVWSAAFPFLQANEQQKSRDILVFLPGQAEIHRCINLFQENLPKQLNNVEILLLPLYGALPLKQQQQVLAPDEQGRQRVLFATNIAETSLTIDGISVVIDSGLERRSLYDVKTGMTRLESGYIAKSSATQRAGRAGRTAAGVAIRLWSESQQQQLADYRHEEIKRADLMDLILELAVWGQQDFNHIDWLTPPPMGHFEKSRDLLQLLGFIDDKGKPSTAGQQAVKLSLPPRLAAIFLSAKTEREQRLAADICALLSEQDILRDFHTVGFEHRLQALWCETDFKKHIKFNVLQQVKATASKILSRVGTSAKSNAHTQEDKESIGRLILAGYPDLLAKKRTENSSSYLLYNGRGAELPLDDPLNQSQWLLVLDIDAQLKSGRIWLATEISESQVLTFTEPHLQSQQTLSLNEKSGKAQCIQLNNFGAIEIKRTVTEDLTLQQKQQLLLQQVKQRGLTCLNWTKQCQRWLERAAWLASVDSYFPQISESTLLADMEAWLEPYLGSVGSMAELQKLDVFSLLKSVLDWEQQTQLDKDAPDFFIAPTQEQFPIRYDTAQGPTVSVQLQTLFGLTDSPKLANHTIPLRFELLSPARRPIQTTSDLHGFWTGSYFEVAKEMRGRYPKHRWPEVPLEEKPGKSLKRR
ncbi:ATP-dependent helicase HrpB [Planctobacterium marinum]|uniref:ATP-dependent helicase HrpB n=1 Tax=Planctobacterium marinum TaxID=1631968 RepID=A0AA48HS82_9ALTE|nr:ATP-dependent helicase HrpB [Planctobacterium marinum]